MVLEIHGIRYQAFEKWDEPYNHFDRNSLQLLNLVELRYPCCNWEGGKSDELTFI
ncbi:MAG: hypothetical protein HXS46_18690 [Theionarchaea archaeon]|nr:hypothetical protein [Theionarchaea archaeon]